MIRDLGHNIFVLKRPLAEKIPRNACYSDQIGEVQTSGPGHGAGEGTQCHVTMRMICT